LDPGQECPKPLHGRSLSPGQTVYLEPADLLANDSHDSCAKLRGGRCEQGAEASDVCAHMASGLDSLEQALVAAGEPVEPRLRRPPVRVRRRAGNSIGGSRDSASGSRATAGRAGNAAVQIRDDRRRDDRRDCRSERSYRIELCARHYGAARYSAKREYEEAQSAYGHRPHSYFAYPSSLRRN